MVTESDKELATLRAALALKGFTVHVLDDGAAGCAYLVGRWNSSRTLPDRVALHKFAIQVGALSCAATPGFRAGLTTPRGCHEC